MNAAQKAFLEIYGPYMDRTHTQAFMSGWEAALKHAAKQADVFRREDTGNNDRWSVYNQGRADALEALIDEQPKK